MLRRKTDASNVTPGRESGRDDFRSLIRRPGVQLVLGAAAALQFGAVQAARPEMAPTVALAPVVAQQPANAGAVPAAWQRKAMERESERLTAKYRAEGYPLTQQLAREIHSAAVEYDIDPEIAFGLVRAESSFKNSATSPVGAVGLTQLMPSTARWLEPGISRSQLRDPGTNLRIGFRYLRDLIEKYDGNENLALLAYNRGPGTVDRALKRGRNPDNGYADFVRGKKDHGHKLFTR